MTKRKITLRSKIGLCLFMCPNVILVSVAYMDVLALLCFIKPAFSLQHSLVNTPPILYVPERNWRISESEQVGQIITRIRAEDPENDDLIFGLEPHFISNYSEENDKHNLPFRIDEVRGNVYLNESLIGRGGENFFLYITVSDGDLTAKNEVFVNILAKDSHMVTNFRTPPSVTSVVQNFSQILPQFNTLLGTQHSNERPINHLPSKFGLNQYMSSHNHHSASNELEIDTSEQTTPLMSTATTNMPPSTTGRIRLKAIIKADNNASVNGLRENIYNYSNDSVLMADSKEKPLQTEINARPVENNKKNKYPYIDPADENASNLISIKAVIIPVIAISCGLFFAAAGFFGFLYRKHLCAFSKKLKKKSKEEITKKSNHSNLSCDLTDGSQNSMVLQHWNGPIAYHNRYVPQQLQNALVTSQLTANSMDRRAIHNTDPGNLSGIQNSSNTIAGETQTGMNMNIGYRSVVESKVDRVICRWEFPRHRLKFFNILGEGAFGQVWRCETIDVDGDESDSTVAVKTLKENATEVEKKDLLSELEVMKSLDPHVNVVRLLGCCTDKDPIFVIIEFVNRGKLQAYLRNSRAERHYGNTHGKSNTLTSSDLTSFMYQVAKGMDYLTSKGIIHRDLAARNILITDDHTCKIADFGFARDVITSKIYERKSEGKLPIRWMAIESLYDNIFSIKSDIWSFGILMWEIVTLGSTPYPGISAADVMRKVRDGYRLEKPEHCRRELYNIMYYCWESEANERPTFVDLVQMLDKLLQTEMDYIELERFPDHNYYNILNLSGEKL